MYCRNCGTQLSNDIKFCDACANELNKTTQERSQPVKLRGFSLRINDPAFAKYIKNSNRWSAIFSLILAFAAVIGFYINGETSIEMNNPESLYIGFVIGSLFLLIALIQILKRKYCKSWDGIVEHKEIKKKRKKQNIDDDFRYEDCLEYLVIIRNDKGKYYEIKVENDDTLYNYYHIGDWVRYHAALKSYEKFDKTGDSFIPCNACGTLCDINDDHCYRCKCPLLK